MSASTRGAPRRVFTSRVEKLASADEVSRVVATDDALLLVTANAFESGWNTCFPEGSRLFLDLFERRFDAAAELAVTFALACADFRQAMKQLVPEPWDDIAGAPAATATAVLIRDGEARCVWIGGDQAFVISPDGMVITHEPDALLHELRRQFGDAAMPDDFPNVLTASYALDRPVDARTATFELPASGRVLLASHGLASLIDVHALSAMLDAGVIESPLASKPPPYGVIVGVDINAVDAHGVYR